MSGQSISKTRVFIGHALQCCNQQSKVDRTYERKSTIVAGSYLWLVRIDKDLGVSSRPPATLASNNAIVSPSDRLSVDKLDSRH
jgi:hypothetical protein